MHTFLAGTLRRLRPAVLALAAAGTLAGCDDLLKVTNPGAINPEDLNQPAYISLMMNGVIGDFQTAHANTALYSGVFTDELRNHHVFFENRDIDLRKVAPENGTYAILVWQPQHRARFMADTSVTRIKTILGDSAKADLRLARVLAYGGHTYVLMGETFCETPINVSRGYKPEEMFQMSLPKFDEAITVATAARAKAAAVNPSTTASRREVAGADSIVAFARVGAARAALNLGDRAKAISYARAVAPAYTSATARGFEFRSYFLENTINNPFWAAAATAAGGGNRWVSVRNTPFDAIVDARVPVARKTVMNGEDTRDGGPFVPNSPTAFDTYTPTGGDFTRSAGLRLASALEARYIIAEAEGLNAANLAFLNQRRAAGGLAPLAANLTAAQFLAQLRDERARDFFMDGHRLGDLRRYDRMYASRTDNQWQTGAYPGSTAGEQYGDQKCWPVPLNELQGNPNY